MDGRATQVANGAVTDEQGRGSVAGRGGVAAPAGGVLLIDLENIVGHRVSVRTLEARLEVLRECAGQVAAIVAACATSAIGPEGEQVLHGHGVRLLEVGPAKHAAEDALLLEAARMAGLGYHRFVAASNDSRMKQLANLGDLEIIVWKQQTPNPAYLACASRVHRPSIPSARRRRPAVAASTANAQTTPAPASAHQRGTRPELEVPVPISEAAQANVVRRAAPWDVGIGQVSGRQLAYAGAALFAAGFLLSAGATMGEVCVRRGLGRFIG